MNSFWDVVLGVFVLSLPFIIWCIRYTVFSEDNLRHKIQKIYNERNELWKKDYLEEFKDFKELKEQEEEKLQKKIDKWNKINDFFETYLTSFSSSKFDYSIKARIVRFFYKIYIAIAFTLFFFSGITFIALGCNYIDAKLMYNDYQKYGWEEYRKIEYPTSFDIEKVENRMKDISENYFYTPELKVKMIDRKLIHEMKEKAAINVKIKE